MTKAVATLAAVGAVCLLLTGCASTVDDAIRNCVEVSTWFLDAAQPDLSIEDYANAVVEFDAECRAGAESDPEGFVERWGDTSAPTD